MLQAVGYVVLSGVLLWVALEMFSLLFVGRDAFGNDGCADRRPFPLA